VGAGGTGSRLMPPLAQLVRTCLRKYNPLAWIDSLPIFIFDGDVVEEKNLLRQNFITKDVGKFKAQVVADRYSRAFDIPIYACNSFLKASNRDFNSIYRSFPEYTTASEKEFDFGYQIIVLAVDSADARRDILNVLGRVSSGPLLVIDAGNEDDFGQVRWFTRSALHFNSRGSYQTQVEKLKKGFPQLIPAEHTVSFIPYDPEYYANLGSSAAELSCADLPQTLAINNMMAALLCSVVQNFLLLKPMRYNGINFGMNGAVGTRLNTIKSWINGPAEVSDKDVFWQSCGMIDPLSLLEEYRVEVLAALDKSGLSLGEDGSVFPKPTPVAVEEKPKRVKKTKKTAEEIGDDFPF